MGRGQNFIPDLRWRAFRLPSQGENAIAVQFENRVHGVINRWPTGWRVRTTQYGRDSTKSHATAVKAAKSKWGAHAAWCVDRLLKSEQRGN